MLDALAHTPHRRAEWRGAARDAARTTAPDVETSHGVIAGETVTALEAESRSAQLLVVGHRGTSGFTQLLLGSTA
ncbi:universal stress protein, partial [Streptomyces bullii]